MHWITTREDLIRLVQARTWTMRDALSPDGELVLQGHILRLVTVGDWAADERCRSGHLCGEQIPVRCPSENARRQNQAADGKYMIS
jgi:hypothetical protein